MAEPLKPSIDEFNVFLAATFMVAVSFIALNRSFTIEAGAFTLFFSAIALFLREMGQRVVSRWMVAETELELSVEGSLTIGFGALTSLLSGLPIIFLFPVENSHDVESYEQWSKSIDAMWVKRENWIVLGGILCLFGGWGVFYSQGIELGAQIISLFTFFQLLPFDYSALPTGRLDGSVIIRQSGFLWLLITGTNLLMILV